MFTIRSFVNEAGRCCPKQDPQTLLLKHDKLSRASETPVWPPRGEGRKRRPVEIFLDKNWNPRTIKVCCVEVYIYITVAAYRTVPVQGVNGLQPKYSRDPLFLDIYTIAYCSYCLKNNSAQNCFFLDSQLLFGPRSLEAFKCSDVFSYKVPFLRIKVLPMHSSWYQELNDVGIRPPVIAASPPGSRSHWFVFFGDPTDLL